MLFHFPKWSGIAMLILSAALASEGSTWGQSESPNYATLKGEVRVLSAVIDESMAQTFSPPFGLLEKTKGAYLPGYGPVFALEVNLYPIPLQRLLTPRPSTKSQLEEELRIKKERIKSIEQTLPRLLAEHAEGLHETKSDEQVAVVVHLFFVHSEGQDLPSEIVIQVKKHDLEQYWDKKLSYEQYLKQVRIAEF